MLLRTAAMLFIQVLLTTALSAADTVVTMKELGGDSAGLAAMKNRNITAYLPLPVPVQKKRDIPALLAAQYSPSKFSFYVLGESCYMVCDERRFKTALGSLVAGRLTVAKGTIIEFDFGRNREGRLRQKYCLLIKDIGPALDTMPHLPSKRNRIGSYRRVKVTELRSSPDRYAHKPTFFTIRYNGVIKLNKTEEVLFGFPPESNRRLVLPDDLRKLAVIGSKKVEWGEVKKVESGKGDINVYGRCFPLHGVTGYSAVFVLDALGKSDTTEASPTPAPHPKVNPNDYKKITQLCLSQVYELKVNERYLFPLMYRGTTPAPQVAKDADFCGRNPLRLNTVDNPIGDKQIRDKFLLLLPESHVSLAQILNKTESGDTVMLRGKIRRLPKSTYCFVVEDLFLPPIQMK